MLNKKYGAVAIYTIKNGNPNGDPDSDNTPRQDPETGRGLITPEATKSKIRSTICMLQEGVPGCEIMIRPGKSINAKIRDAAEECGVAEPEEESAKKARKSSRKGVSEVDSKKILRELARKYYDVRLFGGTFGTGDFKAGSIKGPVVVSFAESVGEIRPQGVTLTRKIGTRDEDPGRTFGHKWFIPFGCYVYTVQVNSAVANATTDISEDDIYLLWDTITAMYSMDISNARPEQELAGFYVFESDSVYGSITPMQMKRVVDVQALTVSPNSMDDIEISLHEELLPKGVTMKQYI